MFNEHLIGSPKAFMCVCIYIYIIRLTYLMFPYLICVCCLIWKTAVRRLDKLLSKRPEICSTVAKPWCPSLICSSRKEGNERNRIKLANTKTLKLGVVILQVLRMQITSRKITRQTGIQESRGPIKELGCLLRNLVVPCSVFL